jgi:hypothetical protein
VSVLFNNETNLQIYVDHDNKNILIPFLKGMGVQVGLCRNEKQP